MKRLIPFALGAVVVAAPAVAAAHFLLVAPAANLIQDQRGDPQKIAPCGGTSANPGTPSGVITPVTGGSMLHIKIQETIFHPGHYRVALAATPSGLPADPQTVTRETERGPRSVSAAIDPNPKPPVLADGLFVHTEKQPAGAFFETDVKIPNIDCDKCVLQVIQWMAEHGYNPDGAYSYHHCSDLKITADKTLPIDKAWAKAMK